MLVGRGSRSTLYLFDRKLLTLSFTFKKAIQLLSLIIVSNIINIHC